MSPLFSRWKSRKKKNSAKDNAIEEVEIVESESADNAELEPKAEAVEPPKPKRVIDLENGNPDFDDLSVIDISSDVEYQLNQERTGIGVVKLEKNKSTRQLNGFDLFFVKFWAAIVSSITFVSRYICIGFNKLFKRELPQRYVTAVISILLIILVIIIVLAPFNLTVGEQNKIDIFSNSLVPVAKIEAGELRWGYANKSGREVIPCAFYNAEPFYHNVAFVQTDSTTWRLIGTNGRFRGELKIKTDSADPTKRVFGDFNNNESRAWIVENGRYTFIKTNGNKAFGEIDYDYAESYSNGYAVVKQGSVWYFINGGGKQKSPSYVEAKSFSEGLAAVKIDRGWTFVDTSFKEVTKGSYFSNVTSFEDGYAWVRMGNTVNLIDKKGKMLLPSEYAGIKPTDDNLRELGFDVAYHN